MIKRLLFVALVSLGVLLVMPPRTGAQQAPRAEQREEFHQTYQLSPTGRVSLENIQGAVRVMVWDRNEVKVDAVKTAYTRELLSEAEIKIDSTADMLRIRTRYPDGSLTFTDDEYRRYQNPASVEYTLTIPRNARLSSIELVNGDLLIEGAAGEVNASSINGRVTARNLKGEVKLSTINGILEATFEKLDESKPVSLGSVNGSIMLVIPSDSNAIVKAGTVHGGITNNFGLPVRRGDYVGRELYGQIGRGGARLKLGNVNGGIKIQHADDGKPLSPASSLLNVGVGKGEGSGKGKGAGTGTGTGIDKDGDWDDEDWGSGEREAVREAQRAVREAQREAARAQLEAQRATREAARAQQEAERAVAAAQREAAQATREAQREAVQAAREAQQEAVQAARAAQAEGVQAAREAQREIAQATREAAREAARAAREATQAGTAVWVIENNDYRLVERDTTKLDVSGTPRLNIETFDGALLIRGWDKPEVSVNVIKRASTEKGLRGIRYQAVKNGDEINITATFDKAFAQTLAPGVTSYNANVSLEIFVPRKVVLRASSGDGRLSLEGVAGELDLRTGDGSVDVLDGNGRLLVKTGDGRIRIANFNGAADASTGDGRIILEGRFTQLAARTGDGTITLLLPADFNAYIESDAEKLINESSLTVTEEANTPKRMRRWKIGSGGIVLSLRTGDGRIILQRADGQ